MKEENRPSGSSGKGRKKTDVRDPRSAEETGFREEKNGNRSGSSTGRNAARRACIWYLGIAVFCAVFSRIYGHFSHEIRSPWMTWLFLWPLAGGYLPALLQAVGILPVFSGWNTDLCRFGIAAGATASLLKGILEIAGTDSLYPDLLLYAGIAMLAVGIVLYVKEAWNARSGA